MLRSSSALETVPAISAGQRSKRKLTLSPTSALAPPLPILVSEQNTIRGRELSWHAAAIHKVILRLRGVSSRHRTRLSRDFRGCPNIRPTPSSRQVNDPPTSQEGWLQTAPVPIS